MATQRTDPGEFVMTGYLNRRPFASFLPGIAGVWGIPMWVFYVNRGQAIAGFGLQDKDHPIMEFEPANRAYRSVPLQGFRTFVKRRGGGGAYYEPFQSPARAAGGGRVTQRMRIRMHDLTLEETNPAAGLEVRVHYFTIPHEPFAALARVVTLTNRARRPQALEVLDGLPVIVPFGFLDRFLKHMSRTIEAWVSVRNLEHRAPFYQLTVEPHDRPEVVPIHAGHFFAGCWEAGGRVQPFQPVVDPSVVFGYCEHLVRPEAFLARSFRVPAQQRAANATPCAMAHVTTTLGLGETATLSSLYGHAEHLEQLNEWLPTFRDPAFFARKARDNARLIRELTDPIATAGGSRTFDGYCRQTFLDNVMRGGTPITFEGAPACSVAHGAGRDATQPPKVYYVYARKHGDLERDYNHFVVPATHFSQGNANYRDVNQNRRSDVWFHPAIADHNVIRFFNLLQADGFNPLVFKDLRYTSTDHADKPPFLRELLMKPFTPGELLKQIERRRLRLTQTPELFLKDAMAVADGTEDAEHGEGFWTDHWTYNLDLLESYLALYPERLKELLVERRVFTFYDNPFVVVPRAQKYRLIQHQLRQLHAVVRDPEKAALIDARTDQPNVVRTEHGRGAIYTTTLLVKMLCVMANKLASLDPSGIGIEMEADKPNWFDALNGLPALLGSSTCETFELKRWLLFVQHALQRARVGDDVAVALPEELHAFCEELRGALPAPALEAPGGPGRETGPAAWERRTEAKERYRHRVRLGFSGTDVPLTLGALRAFLDEALAVVERGLAQAYDAPTGLYRSYFVHHASEYNVGPGATPTVTPKRWTRHALPYFLEGMVHALRCEMDPKRARALAEAVRKSELYDGKLKMYRVCASLAQEPEEIGRCRIFNPGWLENQSVWLHMEYKYLLELLRRGLDETFYREASSALIPFQPPARYGRSVLENSSFLVSSASPDASLHGAGFVARLSGATAEFLQMWLWMMVGREPFFLDDRGALHGRLAPRLPKELFASNGTLTFQFLGHTEVTYRNRHRRHTFGPGGVAPKTIRLTPRHGEAVDLHGDVLPPPYAQMLRSGEVERLDITLES